MKFDTTLLVNELSQMPALTRTAEGMGFDGIWTSETAHDAFCRWCWRQSTANAYRWAPVSLWPFLAARRCWPISPGIWLASQRGVF